MLLIYLSLLFYKRQGNDDDEDDDEDDDVISRLFDKLLFPSCISQGCYEFISKRCWKCYSCSRTTAGIVHTVAYNVHSLYRSVGWGEGVGGHLGQYFLGCAAGLSELLLHYNLFCGQL